MTIRDLQIQQEEVDKKFQTAREFTRGVLVAYQGSVDVPGRPFFVWAREYDQESSIFQAFNTTVSALEGLPVIIGRPWDIFSEYEVVSLDPIVANQPGLGTDPYLVEHAISHQWPAEDNVGADPVEVYQPAFQSFKTIPSSGMVVQVTFGPFVYHSLPFTYATSTVDLTANLPSAGKVRYVLLYVHKQTNALVVLEGLEAILTPIKPDIPGIALSSSYILLTDTTTTITTNEIEDAREMFTGGVNRNEIWMDIAPTGISHTEGQLSWNSVDKTLNVHSGFGNVVVQVGQETQYIVYNNTAGTLLDGRVVHLTGVFQGRVTVDYARSNSYITLEDTLGVLTMDIPPGEFGVGTVQGIVRGIDTSMFSLGQVWVSPTSTTGELTQTKPEFPNYDMSMGIITVVDATNGEITVSIISKASDTFDNAWNGTIRESFNFRVTSDGAIVTGTLAPRTIDANNPDLTMIFSDGFSTLDTLPPITITLIPGTDSTPTVNRVYIPKSTKALTVTTAAWPDVEIIRIAELFIPSAAQAQVDSVLININFTEHLQEVDNVGHMSHIGQKLRRLGSSWDLGITPSVSGTPSDVYFAVTAGVVWQLHPQVFSAKDMAVSDWAYVVNHPTVPYTRITNFNTQTLDALGVSLANSSFSVVLWGCQNREGETSHLFINLPIGSYRKNTPEDAVNDSNSFAIYDFPTEFQATGFLIARFTFTLDAGGTSWVLYSTEDLRGQSPSVSAGGGGGVSKWQVDANGINYQLGNVGIGAESSSGLHNLLILDAVFPAIRLEIPASSNNLTLLANSSGGSVASSANLTLGVALSNEVLIDISPKKNGKV